MDPFCNRVMRLLAIERFCNATIGELHNRWLLVEPILFQREVFSALMEAGAHPAAQLRLPGGAVLRAHLSLCPAMAVQRHPDRGAEERLPHPCLPPCADVFYGDQEGRRAALLLNDLSMRQNRRPPCSTHKPTSPH